MTGAREAASFLRKRLGSEKPSVAIVLGSGLGGIAASLGDARSVGVEAVPGFPAPSVAGHTGRIHLGRWRDRTVLILQGRVHLYEGCPVEAVTLGVRTASALGARNLILTNAAGSCDGGLPPGSLMRGVDLLDLFFRRLRGRRPKPFLGRGGTLDPALGGSIDEAARLEKIRLRHGILCGSPGPSYETAAEIRLWRMLGASAACMSTIPEAWAARDCGMRVAVVSLITNFGTGIARTPLDHEEVVVWAARAGEELGRLLRGAVRLIPGD